MKHADFHIGLEFLASAGFRWRCTDVGTRTILAIQIDHDDPHWYQGPPYIAQEVVFDERGIERCHLTERDAIEKVVHELKTSGHPGYPAAAVTRMMEARYKAGGRRYPHQGVLRFDRRRADGEILHPYAGRKNDKEWFVEIYLPFLESYDQMAERDFIALPLASKSDVRDRAHRHREGAPRNAADAS